MVLPVLWFMNLHWILSLALGQEKKMSKDKVSDINCWLDFFTFMGKKWSGSLSKWVHFESDKI